MVGSAAVRAPVRRAVDRDDQRTRAGERGVRRGPVGVQPVAVLLVDEVVAAQVGRGRHVVEAWPGVPDCGVVSVRDDEWIGGVRVLVCADDKGWLARA